MLLKVKLEYTMCLSVWEHFCTRAGKAKIMAIASIRYSYTWRYFTLQHKILFDLSVTLWHLTQVCHITHIYVIRFNHLYNSHYHTLFKKKKKTVKQKWHATCNLASEFHLIIYFVGIFQFWTHTVFECVLSESREVHVVSTELLQISWCLNVTHIRYLAN